MTEATRTKMREALEAIDALDARSDDVNDLFDDALDIARGALGRSQTGGTSTELNMCAHGADKGSYCGYCGGYSKGRAAGA